MSLKQKIDADLKAAMLSGDKILTTTLRGIKSSILDEEIKQGARQQGLSDTDIVGILSKEAKKRQESADVYLQAGDRSRAANELAEKEVITNYLPEQLSEVELEKLADQLILELGNDPKSMGQIIGQIKAQTQGAADGAIIARIVKGKLQQ